MNAEYLRGLLNKRPFEPFALRMSSGEIFWVKHPECATLTNTRIVVVDPVADRIEVCSLLHISSVQFEQPAAT